MEVYNNYMYMYILLVVLVNNNYRYMYILLVVVYNNYR